MATSTLEPRFWVKVRKTSTCWLWIAGCDRKGYGVFNDPSLNTRAAHRIAYQLLVGPIPQGLDLDHLCRVHNCVNPAHLEPVTRRENLLRGTGFPARRAAQTHCIRGHEFTPKNTYIIPTRGTRSCKTCRAAAKRKVRVPVS